MRPCWPHHCNWSSPRLRIRSIKWKSPLKLHFTPTNCIDILNHLMCWNWIRLFNGWEDVMFVCLFVFSSGNPNPFGHDPYFPFHQTSILAFEHIERKKKETTLIGTHNLSIWCVFNSQIYFDFENEEGSSSRQNGIVFTTFPNIRLWWWCIC